MRPTSLVRLFWLAKLIFGVTAKESTTCHLGLTKAESIVCSESVTVASVVSYSAQLNLEVIPESAW